MSPDINFADFLGDPNVKFDEKYKNQQFYNILKAKYVFTCQLHKIGEISISK